MNHIIVGLEGVFSTHNYDSKGVFDSSLIMFCYLIYDVTRYAVFVLRYGSITICGNNVTDVRTTLYLTLPRLHMRAPYTLMSAWWSTWSVGV